MFRAKTMSEALRETRRVLGADAMIISARTMEGPGGYVEITAVGNGDAKSPSASKRPTPKPSTDDVTSDGAAAADIEKSLEPIRRDMMALRKMINDLAEITNQAVLPGFTDLRTLFLEYAKEQESAKMLGPIYTELVEMGILPEIARDLVRAAEMQLGMQQPDRKNWLSVARGIVRDLVAKRIRLSGPMVPGESRCFVFVGPSGVGKTTTLAKIASRMALSEGLDVVMVTTDTYRVGSVEQSRRYAELIGIPLVVVDRPETMVSAMRSYAKADAVLIDTPGRVFESAQVREAVSRLLLATGCPLETHLLISAAYAFEQQRAVVDQFAALEPSRLIMTKVDECAQLGNLVNIQHVTSLPFSYLTRGQRVPEDIEVAGAGRIAQLLFRHVME